MKLVLKKNRLIMIIMLGFIIGHVDDVGNRCGWHTGDVDDFGD